jgi:hypothetical protein
MPVTLTPNLAWMLLIVAGLLEIVWSVGMKASHGFTRHHFTTITLVVLGSASGYSGWRYGSSQSVLPTQSGPGLALSERLFSVSSCSASRQSNSLEGEAFWITVDARASSSCVSVHSR